MKKLSILALLSLSAVSCNMTEAPRVRAHSEVRTQYVFRGVAMNARPVLQGSMTTEFQVNPKDRLSVSAWGNMSLTAGTGDAVFTSTDILDVDENRWVLDYHHPFEQEGFEEFHGGLIQYNRAGVATRELFAATKLYWDEFVSEVGVYWDVDEADGMYANGSIQSYFEVDERTTGYWKAALGAASSNMAEALYGDDGAGLADLLVEVGAVRPLNKNTTANAVLAVSSVLADDDALDAADIDSTQVWLGMGVVWSF